MDPAIAFPLMLLPFVAVIAFLVWNLQATRRAMAEGEPATFMRPARTPVAEETPVVEEAPALAVAAADDVGGALAAMRAEIEKQREDLDRRAAQLLEMESRLARRD